MFGINSNESTQNSTQNSTRRLFTRRAFTTRAIARRGAPLLLAAGLCGAALLGGCGGGGGNGNTGGGTTGTGTNTGTGTGTVTGNADISGKVTDASGNGIPGASIIPDTGGTVTASLGQGGYRLNNLPGNVVHKITASAQSGGVQYTGSTQVYAQSSFLTSNANIVLSQVGRQATVSGTVRDSGGNGIPNVRVFLALPNNAQFSSLVAFTGSTGAYSITNVPTDLPSGSAVTVAASTTSAQNQTAPLGVVLQPGGSYNHDFVLSASAGQAVTVPAIQKVFTSTEPTDSQSGRLLARAAGATPTSIYERLRRALSPDYARTADRVAATGKRLRPRALGDYAIETDLVFTPSVGSVGFYNVYRTTGSNAVTETATNGYDSLYDPLANYYTDVTFSTNQSTTAAGTQYNFALSATTSDTNGIQTGLSPTFSIVPLGLLSLSQPTVGQVFTGAVTLTWTPITGATKYYVFIYDQYPTFAGNPAPVVSLGAPLAATASSYTTTLTPGKDYYAVVVGGSDQNETPGQTNTNPVTNAALSFSQITRFHVQ